MLDAPYSTKDYRLNVGLCVKNKAGLILCGQRRFIMPDAPGHNLWQMPQGGIDEGESFMEAAYRELWEETSLTAEHVTHVHTLPNWIKYDWPAEFCRDTPYIGQQQRWVVFQYDGPLPEIKTLPHDEFTAFEWLSADQLLQKCADFRKGVYTEVLGSV